MNLGCFFNNDFVFSILSIQKLNEEAWMTQILPDLGFKDLEDIQLWPYYWKVFNSQFQQYLIFDDYPFLSSTAHILFPPKSIKYLSSEVSSEVKFKLDISTIQYNTSYNSYESKSVSLTFVLWVS